MLAYIRFPGQRGPHRGTWSYDQARVWSVSADAGLIRVALRLKGHLRACVLPLKDTSRASIAAAIRAGRKIHREQPA